MFENLRQSAGLLAARYRFRKAQDEVISFSQIVSSAGNALCILPLDTESVHPIAPVVDLLKTRFGSENITIVSTGHSADIIRSLPRGQFIHIVPGEIGAFYLPRRELIQRIKSRSHELAVDLNLDFLLPSGYICKASGARVRIGFARERADTFYNFQIRTDPALARKEIYARLANCLEKF